MPNERKYTFKCPECETIFTYDQPAEPLCTGPGPLSQHEGMVMERVFIKDLRTGRERFVSKEEGQARAQGTLWLPWNLVTNEAKVNGELWVPKDNDPNWTDREKDALLEAREQAQNE